MSRFPKDPDCVWGASNPIRPFCGVINFFFRGRGGDEFFAFRLISFGTFNLCDGIELWTGRVIYGGNISASACDAFENSPFSPSELFSGARLDEPDTVIPRHRINKPLQGIYFISYLIQLRMKFNVRFEICFQANFGCLFYYVADKN